MKNLAVVIFCIIVFAACSNHHQANVSRKVTLVNETPTYIKDRELSKRNNDNVNAHGLYGPGFGESYASNSYREDDLHNLPQDSMKNRRSSNANKQYNINENPGYTQIDGANDINSISKWDRNFINKYDQSTSDNTRLCTWHAPLKLNEGLNQNGQLCYR